MSTPISQLVSLLIAAGLSPDTIALAVDLAEQHRNSAEIPQKFVDEQAERRRAKDRERYHSKRNCTETPQNSAEIPQSGVAAISFLREDSKKERKIERGTRISAEWKPTEDHYQLGSRLGFDKSKVDSFGQDMRLWAEANAHRPVARKLDWDKTFAGWLRRQKPGEAPPKLNGHANHGRDPPPLPPDKRHFMRWFHPDLPRELDAHPEKWENYVRIEIHKEKPPSLV